jgi:4'-phosphopantetheinyl transferase
MLPFTRVAPSTQDQPIPIEHADVHVWAFILRESNAIVEAWRELLSDDERLRADRFVRRRDRARWIVAHGVLRHALGRYCGVDPRAIAFVHGVAGKPSLAQAGAHAVTTTFNLAHSHDRALLAVSRDREIGVDLEQVRDDFDPLPIAREFFFGTELAAIQAAAPELRREAFFRHWTAKEAVLKAHGAGLSLALDSFCVTFEAGGSIARVRPRGPAALDPALLVRMLPLPAGWHGAVAASGEDWTLRFAA